MKKRYAQVLLFSILMINSLSIYSMLTQASRAQKTAASRRAVQASRFQVMPRSYSNVTPEEGEGRPTSAQQPAQGWFSRLWSNSAPASEKIVQPVASDWLSTLWYGEAAKPAENVTPIVENVAPEKFIDAKAFANEFRSRLSRGIETMYHPELTSRGYAYHGIAFPGNTPQFDDNDLQELKIMIDNNRDMLNELTTDPQGGFGPFGMNDYTFFYKLSFLNKVSPQVIKSSRQVTILDIALRKFFGSDNALIDNFTASEPKLKLIELINYLIDAGAIINSDNKKIYKRAYLDHMMPSYQKLYSDWGSSWFGVNKSDQSEKPIMKKIFEEFDPVLERIIPKFKNKLHKAQEERVKIENSGKRTEEYWGADKE